MAYCKIMTATLPATFNRYEAIDMSVIANNIANNVVLITNEEDIYNIIGDDGFNRLIAAFYRQIPTDPILGPMYPANDLEGAEKRLRGFLLFRFGGPADYLDERGHPRLRMRHAPFPITEAACDRWMQLMLGALDEAKLPPDADRTLREFFGGTSTFLINRLS